MDIARNSIDLLSHLWTTKLQLGKRQVSIGGLYSPKRMNFRKFSEGGWVLSRCINLPGPQITWKWTMHTDKLTTKCHICLHTWKQGGLMCGIWDWQSTIVKDLNDSQDPKHTLICRENAFVAIYALFSDNKCPLFTRLEGGVAQSGHCLLFWPFFLCDGFP